MPASDSRRTSFIVDALTDAFQPLMAADSAAFRSKFRKMAADPYAFYRGSACLFYADMGRLPDSGTATSSTTSRTSSARRGSVSAAPGCRRTTC